MSAALDITGLSRAALAKAWAKMANVLTAVVLKNTPTVTPDIVADTESVSWAESISTSCFFYKAERDENEASTDLEGGVPAIPITKTALFRRQDIGATTPDHQSVVTEGAVDWDVVKVEDPPGSVIVILKLSQKK